MQDRQKLLHEKERRAHVDREETIEILDAGLFDRRVLGDTGIGNEDIQAITDDGPDLPGELVRPVGRGEIGRDDIGAAAGPADFRNNSFRRLRAARVMDEHLGAGLGERQCAGAADAARGAGDESRFS